MASKKSIFSKHVEHEGEQQPLDKADEVPVHESDGGSDSDSETEEDETPKKPRWGLTRKGLGSGPGEDGSECSSPSASAFIIMPSSKPIEKKKGSASKKFTEEEEIALLKGLATFWANGRNNKWTEFHHFVKDDLPREFTKIQVSEKIRGLKRKFDTNMEKARANGGRLDISDHHESVLFELSKRLWGDEKGVANEKENGQETPLRKEHKNIVGKVRKNAETDGDEESRKLKKQKLTLEIGKEEFESEYPLLCSSFEVLGYPKFLKDKFYLIGREKAQELEERWRELNGEALRLELKRIDLTKRDLLNHRMGK